MNSIRLILSYSNVRNRDPDNEYPGGLEVPLGIDGAIITPEGRSTKIFLSTIRVTPILYINSKKDIGIWGLTGSLLVTESNVQTSYCTHDLHVLERQECIDITDMNIFGNGEQQIFGKLTLIEGWRFKNLMNEFIPYRLEVAKDKEELLSYLAEKKREKTMEKTRTMEITIPKPRKDGGCNNECPGRSYDKCRFGKGSYIWEGYSKLIPGKECVWYDKGGSSCQELIDAHVKLFEKHLKNFLEEIKDA